VLIRDLAWLPELVRAAADEYGEAAALQSANSKASGLSYAQLLDRVERAAATLRAHKLARGSHVLLALESRPEWAAAFFGILEAGLVAVPVPADTTGAAATAIAAHAQISLAVVSQRTRDLAEELSGIACIGVDELFTHEPGSTRVHAAARRELAMLAFTSGSTRQPRAVELSHDNLLCNLDALLQLRSGGRGDAMLSILPPAHLFELMVGLLAPLACGARVVYAGAPLPNRIVNALREHEITHALAVSAIITCLYEEIVSQLVETGVIQDRGSQSLMETAQRLETELDAQDLQRISDGVRAQIGSTFATLVVGGAAIDPALARIISAIGIQVHVGYGLTEASPVVSLGLVGQCPDGSVGRPLPGVEVRIAANGEILVRGANVMRGYFRDPEATSAAFEQDWLRTGDHGRLDSDGFLFITGRLKEAMVTAAGETIYPEEIEPYYEHPLFAEGCVAALPDANGNDVPTLFVVPSDRNPSAGRLEDAFATLRAAAPARYRVGKLVQLSQPLPRTAAGKIRRRVIAEHFKCRGPNR
jgi:long-chain acyl-CoA synthetase